MFVARKGSVYALCSALLIAQATGCYSPKHSRCAIRCHRAEPTCPPEFVCLTDNYCHGSAAEALCPDMNDGGPDARLEVPSCVPDLWAPTEVASASFGMHTVPTTVRIGAAGQTLIPYWVQAEQELHWVKFTTDRRDDLIVPGTNTQRLTAAAVDPLGNMGIAFIGNDQEAEGLWFAQTPLSATSSLDWSGEKILVHLSDPDRLAVKQMAMVNNSDDAATWDVVYFHGGRGELMLSSISSGVPSTSVIATAVKSFSGDAYHDPSHALHVTYINNSEELIWARRLTSGVIFTSVVATGVPSGTSYRFALADQTRPVIAWMVPNADSIQIKSADSVNPRLVWSDIVTLQKGAWITPLPVPQLGIAYGADSLYLTFPSVRQDVEHKLMLAKSSIPRDHASYDVSVVTDNWRIESGSAVGVYRTVNGDRIDIVTVDGTSDNLMLHRRCP